MNFLRVFLSFWAFCCGFFALAQPISFSVRPIEGYQLDPKKQLSSDLNFFVVSDERTFKRMFGTPNEVTAPDFEFDQVIVMAMKPTKREVFIRFAQDAYKAGNYLEVYCSIERVGRHKLTYEYMPLAIAVVPKFFHVNQVRFYSNGKRKMLLGIVQYRR